MSKKILLTLLLIFAMVLVACGGDEEPTEEPAAPAEQATEAPAEQPAEEPTEAPAEEPAAEAPAVDELTIFWAQWDPADYLQEIGNMYEAETGIKVNVIQEPWGSFGTVFNTEMAAQGDSWDMVVGDSQWLGTNATNGNYIELTDFMNENGLTDSVTPATLQYYGEYPPGQALIGDIRPKVMPMVGLIVWICSRTPMKWPLLKPSTVIRWLHQRPTINSRI